MVLRGGAAVALESHKLDRRVQLSPPQPLFLERSCMDSEYDFSWASDIDLIMMQHQAREYPEDEGFVKAVLLEMGRRQKEKAKAIDEARAKHES